MFKLLLSILVFVTVFGHDSVAERLPTKEISFSSRTIPFTNEQELVVVSDQDNDKRLQVNYELKDQDLYVECIIKDFSFNREKVGSIKKEGEGHIHLYVNGSKVDSIFKPAFIIKNLPSGTYKIKLKLVHNDLSPYGIEEEFEIENLQKG